MAYVRDEEIRYAGFWIRFLASLLDTIFLALPVGILIYFMSGGEWFDFSQFMQNLQMAMSANPHALDKQPQTSLKWELFFEFALLIITILFWRRFKGATPGKRFIGIHVVDAKTLDELSSKQAITRSFGYVLSTGIFLIGFLMVGLRKDKRGLHDILADTLVIYDISEKKE